MSSGRALYDACCIFLDEPYSTSPGRTDPNSGYKDCSGMVAAGFEVCQGYELGAYVTTTIFEQSVLAGREIPYWAAINIVGALIFKPENPYAGWGPNGHIAVSDGYGGTVEATPPRVQRLPLSYNAPWSSKAALAIDLDYSNYGEGTVQQPEPELPKENIMYIVVGDQEYLGRIAFCVDGSYRVGEPFTGAQGPYGIPQSAYDWNNDGGRDLKYVFLDGPRLEEVFARTINSEGSDVSGGPMKISLEGTATPA